MDYAGRDFRNIRYAVDRPLTDAERGVRFRQQQAVDAPPMDFLSVIRFNSTYMELVDRWYPVAGFSVWLGALIAAISAFGTGIAGSALFWSPPETERAPLLILLFVMASIGLAMTVGGIWLIRSECWRWTHYPMRVNRKTRQVHVFRQDGTTLTVPWDDLFIVRGEAKNPMTDTTYDLRAHVLEEDGHTVRESFTLGYPSPLGNAQSIDKFWAFLQPYMEAPDGVERTYRHLKEGGYLVAVDGRKEGWRWSITRTFMLAAHWPWLQLLAAPALGNIAIGRMFAMWTSKQPRWPQEVEQANVIDADDPYVLTWRDNAPLGWRELYWPLICTIVGVGVFVGAIGWIVSSMFI